MDLYLFQQLNQFALRWLWIDTIGIFFARYFEYILVGSLLIFLVVNFRKYWKMILGGLIAAVLSRFVIVEIIRFFWHRSRPFVENQVNLLISHSATPSFPSGHAAFYFAIATLILLYFRKFYPLPKFWWLIGSLFLLSAFLISLARVFAGIHWPSDILAGALVGIFSGCVIMEIPKKLK